MTFSLTKDDVLDINSLNVSDMKDVAIEKPDIILEQGNTDVEDNVDLEHATAADPHDQSVMIALLPSTSEWCKLKVPHLTLVYCGEIDVDELRPSMFNELAKDALSLAIACPSLTLEVLDHEILGEEEKVDTFLLRPTPALLAMRKAVEQWNRSSWVGFTPHVTIGPVGSFTGDIPEEITFDRIMVSWGTENLIYQLT